MSNYRSIKRTNTSSSTARCECCNFVRKHKSYIRIFIMGMLQLVAITSVYKYLNNVDSIEVMPDSHASSLDGHVNGGISCYSKTKFNGCNTMSYLMDNATKSNTTINSTVLNVLIVPNNKWRCDLYTDYSERSLQDTFSSFDVPLILLFIFTCTYVLSAIIHDFTLIYHRNHLDKVIFHPINSNDFYLSSKFFSKCDALPTCMDDNGNNIICVGFVRILILILSFPVWFACVVVLGVVLGVIGVFFVIIDAVGYLFGFYPFIYWCINRGPNQKRHINAVSYISSSWVAVSKCGMVLSTMVILLQISEGISSKVPSPIPDKCLCQCVYVLHKNDYYAWLFVTISFALLNVKSVWSWMYTYETKKKFHKQHYLYLILCSSPLKYANQINPEDSSDDVMVIKSLNKSRNDQYKNYRDEIQDKQLIVDNGDECQLIVENILSYLKSESSKAPFLWRSFILILLISIVCNFVAWSISNLKEINFYHYSDVSKKVLTVAYWIINGILWVTGFAFWVGYRMRVLGESFNPL